MATGKSIQPKPKSIEDDWKARSDFNTLAEAEKIKGNPDRLKKAREYGVVQLEAAQRVTGAIATSSITPQTK